MQLLLFLSALLAGLTGAFSGERAVRLGGQHGETAITRAAEAVADAAVSITQVPVVLPAMGRFAAAPFAFAITAAPLALPARLTTGRWLE